MAELFVLLQLPSRAGSRRTRAALGTALAGSAWALIPHAAAAAAPEAAADASAIQVVGHRDPEGLLPDQIAPQAVSAVSTEFISKQAPTLNAFQLVNLLPGANVSSTDPYGLSVSSSLTLRGLGQDEIGVTMEGAPQNDIGYYYAYPSQFADAENVRQVALAQGSADIAAPVIGGAGGLLSLTLDDPATKAGALVDLSVGSYAERRGFVRLDSGEIGGTGLRGFLSYSNSRADNWRGAGFDRRQHVDAKLLRTWGDGNRASVSVSFNDANTSTYPSPTLADWRTEGRGFNYDKRYTVSDTNYWRLYRSPFRKIYLAAPFHLRLSDRLTFDSTSYLQFGYGNSPYGTQLAADGNFLGTEALAAPIALPPATGGDGATVLGNFTGDQVRLGTVASLGLRAGAHRFTLGAWIDTGTDRVLQTYGAVGADGHPLDPWGRRHDAIRTADGRLFAYENERTVTATKAFFVADQLTLSPRLTVDLGFKGVDVLHNGRNHLPGPQARVRFDSFAPLPRAAVHYQLSERQQLFANVTTSFRAPDEYTLYNVYDGAGGISGQGTTDLKNEYSVAEELGYRYIGPSLSASLTGFHYHFRNRQLSTVIDNGGAQIASTINAGRQTSYGVDGEIDWRPARGMSLYLSGEYLHTRLDDDLPVGDDVLPTRGKRAVASPAYQFGLGGTYDDGLLFGSAALKYVARQYATFVNDESIPGYATLDLSVGVHLGPRLDKRRTDLRLNVLNVTDPHVLSGVEAITANAQNTPGRGGTVIAGTVPAYYIGSGRAVMATLSRAF